MNRIREKRKRSECLSHRIVQYDKAIDGLMAGTHSPEYVTKRWHKIKELLRR